MRKIAIFLSLLFIVFTPITAFSGSMTIDQQRIEFSDEESFVKAYKKTFLDPVDVESDADGVFWFMIGINSKYASVPAYQLVQYLLELYKHNVKVCPVGFNSKTPNEIKEKTMNYRMGRIGLFFFIGIDVKKNQISSVVKDGLYLFEKKPLTEPTRILSGCLKYFKNYYVIVDDKLEIFYDHWGAKSLRPHIDAGITVFPSEEDALEMIKKRNFSDRCSVKKITSETIKKYFLGIKDPGYY